MDNRITTQNSFYFKNLEKNRTKLTAMTRGWLKARYPHTNLLCWVNPNNTDIDRAIQWLQKGEWKSYPQTDSDFIHCSRKTTGLPFTVTVAKDGNRAYLDRKKPARLEEGCCKLVTKSIIIDNLGGLEKCVSLRFGTLEDARDAQNAAAVLKRHQVTTKFEPQDCHSYKPYKKTTPGITKNKAYAKLADKDLLTDCDEKYSELISPYTREKTLKDICGSILPALLELENWHSKNIVHRDIKLENLFKAEGRFWLADTDWATDKASKLPVGTPRYYLPALQFDKVRSVELMKQGDVFAIGCTILSILNSSFTKYQDNLTRIKHRWQINQWQNDYLNAKHEILATHSINEQSDFEKGLRQLMLQTLKPMATPNISEVISKLTDLLSAAKAEDPKK